MKTPFPFLRTLALLSPLLLAACFPSEPPAPPAAPGAAPSAPPTSSAIQPLLDQTLAALQALPNQAACSVEAVVALPAGSLQPAVNNTYTAALNGDIKFIGFAADVDKGEPLARFTLLLAGRQVFGVQAASGLERPDVGEYFKKPGLLKSGFQADISLKGVPAGEYLIMLRADDGPVCPTHQKLKVD